MSVITRRELMKQGLKATAYVAPAVLTMAPAPVGAQVSGPACHTTFTMTPASSSSVQWAPVLSGTGFTPNGTVSINNISGWIGQCRGIVIVPGTSFQADASGNFNLVLPKTALNFSVVTTGQVFPITVTDVTTGCSSTANYTITPITQSPADSLTLVYVPSPVSSPLAPPAPPVPGESGSGTVLLGQCHSALNPSGTNGPAELRFTLNGATPNRTFTLFITPSAGAALAVGRTVTTDAAGNASFAAYITVNNGVFTPGASGVCFGNLSSATLSLTIDGNPPGASNVAYRSTLVRNDNTFC
jgi:hypothetical protein